LAAIRVDPRNISDVGKDLRSDREFARQAIGMGGGEVVDWLSDALRGDRQLVSSAFGLTYQKARGALRWASDELRNDHSFVMQAVRAHCTLAREAPSDFMQDPDFVISVLRDPQVKLSDCLFGSCYCYGGECHGFPLSWELARNKDFALRALHMGRFDVAERCCYYLAVEKDVALCAALKDYALRAMRTEPFDVWEWCCEYITVDQDFALRVVSLGLQDILDRCFSSIRFDRAFASQLSASLDFSLGVPGIVDYAGLRKRAMAESHPKEAIQADLWRSSHRGGQRSRRQAEKSARLLRVCKSQARRSPQSWRGRRPLCRFSFTLNLGSLVAIHGKGRQRIGLGGFTKKYHSPSTTMSLYSVQCLSFLPWCIPKFVSSSLG